jgi:hypothetical protein
MQETVHTDAIGYDRTLYLLQKRYVVEPGLSGTVTIDKYVSPARNNEQVAFTVYAVDGLIGQIAPFELNKFNRPRPKRRQKLLAHRHPNRDVTPVGIVSQTVGDLIMKIVDVQSPGQPGPQTIHGMPHHALGAL